MVGVATGCYGPTREVAVALQQDLSERLLSPEKQPTSYNQGISALLLISESLRGQK